MNRRSKAVFAAWYNLRKRIGLEAWYHSTEVCHDHLIPRFHKVEFSGKAASGVIELCGKGVKDYQTGERIQS